MEEVKEELKEGKVRCIVGNRTEVVEGVVVIDKMFHGGGKIIIKENVIWCVGWCTILEYIDE